MSSNEKSIIFKKGDTIGKIGTKKKQSRYLSYHAKRNRQRGYFLHNKDKEKFLYYLFRAKERGRFELYGYCLMDNHIHLLMKEGEGLGESIKRMAVGYVQWHNKKYGRTGHLFQNRYKSEIVEDDRYLIAVARYIHQNPVKAKMVMVKDVEGYKWGSYKDYILSYNGESVKTDTDLIMGCFDTLDVFQDYMKKPNTDEFLEYKIKESYTDEELKNVINNMIDLEDMIKLPKEKRDKIICYVYESTGASIRQLSKAMGIGRGVIQKAVKNVPN